MKVLYYDCFSGISGDMHLGAMIDAGVPAEYLLNELKKIHIEGYELKISKGIKNGITGTRVEVILTQNSHHHHHNDASGHGHGHGHHHHHEHNRNLKDIFEILDNSHLTAKVIEDSKKMFTKVAEAEAKIHGKTIDEVHFHEVGAIDSIVDTIGAAICINYLNPDHIIARPVELGSGFVNCAHGRFPVPAPATAEILKGIPVKTGNQPFEATTPTGAAILATLVDEFTESTNFTIHNTFYGLGFKESDTPNVLRVMIGEKHSSKSKHSHTLIECNIDDMPAETLGYTMDKLFEAGADDVYFTPIVMKKSRSALTLSVLCSNKLKDTLQNIIFEETTTLGIRYSYMHKEELSREFEKIETEFGSITIKKGILNGKTIKIKPEYEDCAAAAKKHNVSLQTIYKAVNKEILKNE